MLWGGAGEKELITESSRLKTMVGPVAQTAHHYNLASLLLSPDGVVDPIDHRLFSWWFWLVSQEAVALKMLFLLFWSYNYSHPPGSGSCRSSFPWNPRLASILVLSMLGYNSPVFQPLCPNTPWTKAEKLGLCPLCSFYIPVQRLAHRRPLSKCVWMKE